MPYARNAFVSTLLALAIASASVSCGATRGYEGEARPASETALIVGMSAWDPLNFGNSAKVVSVDGKPVEGGTKIELLPGKHTLEIYANTNWGTGTRTLEVELEAGIRYVIGAAVDPETLVVVVAVRER